uniref:Glycerol-3-phosphate acyltransferase N-terminal n=1 Tax=virus sp. ctDYl1 TaxID=2826795 RepID=A0A8S5RA28_9VIRU|nr:MAG TPA: Glycerol-3-phosphate acyltransferase N-terminal [virus sp. ctDYl1]
MGRWADLPASVLDDREGVYINLRSAVVTTSTSEKIKKALLNMAGIVIRTRQAVSLNCFSAILKIRQYQERQV